MPARGDRVPHFDVTTLDGSRVRYSDIWQRQNLLLVTLPAADPSDARQYAAALIDRLRPLPADTECVVTTDAVAGIRTAGVVVADRWGEIYCAREAAATADLPTADEITGWLDYVRSECPECQGEAL